MTKQSSAPRGLKKRRKRASNPWGCKRRPQSVFILESRTISGWVDGTHRLISLGHVQQFLVCFADCSCRSHSVKMFLPWLPSLLLLFLFPCLSFNSLSPPDLRISSSPTSTFSSVPLPELCHRCPHILYFTCLHWNSLSAFSPPPTPIGLTFLFHLISCRWGKAKLLLRLLWPPLLLLLLLIFWSSAPLIQ